MPSLGLQHNCVVLASGPLLVGNADVDSFRPELREELRRYSYVEAQNLILNFSRGMADQEANETMAEPDLVKEANL
jgi:hypothetical protein